MRPLLLALLLFGPLVPSLAHASGAASLELSGCENLSGSFPVLASDARATLPPGFQPRSAETTLHSVFWIVSAHCAGARVDGVEVGEAWFSYAELDLLPPPLAWRIPGIDSYTVPVFALAEPREVADALASFGLPRVALSETTAETLPGGAKRVSVGAEGGGFEMVGGPVTGAATITGGEWGMFGVADRQVVSTIRGRAEGGTAGSSLLAQASEGALPLMLGARPVARGGMVEGFDLAFARVG